MITFPQLVRNWQVKYLSTMALGFRNIILSDLSESFQFVSTDSNRVLSLFKGAGLDGISTRLITDCADLIAPHISIIFNSSLANGILPDGWKSASLSKAKEAIIYTIIVQFQLSRDYNWQSIWKNYLQSTLCQSDHNILSKHQSGFRALHSTVTASLEATDSWDYNIDIGCVKAVVFLDFMKAFDTVDHHTLLSKLHLYGITGVSHKWFSSCLDSRTQKCIVNGSLSECWTLKWGILQGTILGLYCFCCISMICPIVCLTLSQECMQMIPIWLIRMVISTPFILPCIYICWVPLLTGS